MSARLLAVGTDAAEDRTSEKYEVGNHPYVSIHFIWAGLTGVLDAEVSMEVSNSGLDGEWEIKGSTTVISTADGKDFNSFNGVVTEQFVRAVYGANGVLGGTITALVHSKGGWE
jgi:hypothetical protein